MAEKAQLLTNKYQQAQAHEEANRTGDAIKTYEEVIRYPLVAPDEILDEAVKAKEQSTYRLANIYRDKGLVDELIQL